MKIEKCIAKNTEVGKGKNGYIPTPPPIMSNIETRGMVPSPAPSSASNPQPPSPTTKK